MIEPRRRRYLLLICACVVTLSFFCVGAWFTKASRTSAPLASGRLPDTWEIHAEGVAVSDAERRVATLLQEAKESMGCPVPPDISLPDWYARKEARRTDFDLRERFLRGPAYVTKADELAYHVELNPHGRALTPMEALELHALVTRWSRILGRAYVHAAIGRDAEFLELIDAGAMQPLEYADDPRTAKILEETRARHKAAGDVEEPFFTAAVFYKSARGLSHFQRRHGANFGASDADLPRYKRMQEAAGMLALDYFDIVAAWFAGHVFLTTEQALTVRSRVRGG